MNREQRRKKHQREIVRHMILEGVIWTSLGFALDWFLRSAGLDLYGLIEAAFGG